MKTEEPWSDMKVKELDEKKNPILYPDIIKVKDLIEQLEKYPKDMTVVAIWEQQPLNIYCLRIETKDHEDDFTYGVFSEERLVLRLGWGRRW